MYWHRFSFVLTALALVAGVAMAEPPPKVIRIGSGAAGASFGRGVSSGVPGWVSSHRFVEEEFAKDGVKIEWSHIASAGPGANEAMASDSIDFAYYGDFPAIIGKAGGLNTKLIVPGQRGLNASLIVPPNSTAVSIRDLVGKRIAMQRGRPWELAFTQLLAANGLKDEDFQLFNLADPDGQTALLAGGVDAIFGTDDIIVGSKHLAKTIWTTRDKPLDWRSTSDLFVNVDFAKKYPQTTERVAKAFVRGAYAASLDANREDLLQTWAKASYPYDVLVRSYDGVPFKQAIVPMVDPFLIAHYKAAVAYAAKAQLITEAFPVEDWIDSRYVTAALKELDLEHYWARGDVHGAPIEPDAALQ
jgi:sulfonate transport system substrate-binding protein